MLVDIGLNLGNPRYAPDRKAVLKSLKNQRDNWSSGVLHCFTGTRQALYDYLDMGC